MTSPRRGQQRNVEARIRIELGGALLVWGEEIEQQRPQPSLSQRVGHEAASRCVAVAAVAVGEEHQAPGVRWNDELAFELSSASGDDQRLFVLSNEAHDDHLTN